MKGCTGDWNSERIDALRFLWAAGHTTATIAARLGVTKNAVIGKAHRLNLPPRPSPIRSRGPVAPKASSGRTRLARRRARSPEAALAEPSASAEVIPMVPRRPALEPRSGPVRACAWPIGEPRRPGFRFCGEPTLPGRPYCGPHATLAYAVTRARRA